MTYGLSIIFLLIGGALSYDPTWDSIDSRPLPAWFDQAKFGIFIHWGVYSVPSFGSEWFWWNWKSNSSAYVEFMEKNYPPDFTYQDFGKDFTAEFFNPDDWANLFSRSGAKYVVLTSKHHEGYTLWPSTFSFSWNSMDVGPHRDLVGDLSAAVQNAGLRFGLYHSLYEFFNPMWLADKENNFTTNVYVTQKLLNELREIINNYQPHVLWSDGDWEAPDTYWQATEFLAWLYNESPVKDVVVTNDRWGSGIPCNHGGYFTCTDRYNPGVLQPRKWENCMTIDGKSWGFRRNANIEDYLTPDQLLETLVITVSTGGNLLMNVGPTKDGMIAPIFQERLLNMGEWLSINGEGIYNTVPWTVQNDTLSGVTWYTRNENAVFAITLEWPDNNVLSLGSVSELFSISGVRATLLGNGDLTWSSSVDTVDITFPDQATVASRWAWVVKITNSTIH